MVTLKCLECSKEFEAQRSSAKFCSTKCRVDYNRRSEEQKTEVQPTGIIEEKINKQVENFVNLPTTETELKGIIPAKEPEKIVLPKAKDIMLGADYLADVPKITFHELLIEFNSLVQDKPQVNRELEEKLYNLTLKAKNSDLPPRQSEAIRERCINYLTGQYGTKSKK